MPSLFVLWLTACDRDDLYTEATFTQNVSEAYADCRPDEIRWLASKQNLQTVFKECGSNNFVHFQWSPDGLFVYFQLPNGGYFMDAENKKFITVPTAPPNGPATWGRKDLLVVPVPADDQGQGQRLALFDRGVNTLVYVDVAASNVLDLAAWGDGESMIATVERGSGREVVRISLADGAVTPAFAWLSGPVDQVSWSGAAGLLAVTTGTHTRLLRADGSLVVDLPGIKRAVPHPGGRYVALELDGATINPFDQRAWDEVSPEARERELARQEEWLERLPEWAPKELVPPEIHILDLEKRQRIRFTGFYGDQFQWYEAQDYYGSFILWGIEGKQLKRNVALANLSERLRMVGGGEIPLGLEVLPFPGDAAPPAEAAPDPVAPALSGPDTSGSPARPPG